MEATVAPSSKSPTGIEGSCACGRITYTGSQLPTYMTNCHCQTCRKLAGAPYLTWAIVPRASVEWNTPPDIWSCSQIADRGHCSRCGACMTMKYHHRPEGLAIAAGTIDRSAQLLRRPESHIFLQEKAPWFELLDDGLDRFDEFDQPFQEKLDVWKKAQNL
jgi:hypothetical protein